MGLGTKDHLPRFILYHQTHHHEDRHVSLLPLLTYSSGISHLILAAIHLENCSAPHNVHLNNDPPNDPKFDLLWEEVEILQKSNVKIMLMLGGAARGSYALLDGSEELFEKCYRPLHDLIIQRSIQGIDLDVEERFSMGGITRLIDRLRSDFGSEWIISLAPVATAMHRGYNLSGFDYACLEAIRGDKIDFYNTQFYCNHGSLVDTASYEKIMRSGWDMKKIVVGMITNHANGAGWVPIQKLKITFKRIYELLDRQHPRTTAPGIGGIMGWEYYNSLPGDLDQPHQWMCLMSRLLDSTQYSRISEDARMEQCHHAA